MVVVGIIFGELADDQALELRYDAHEAQLVNHSLDFVDRFRHVLDEKDGARLDYVERCGDEVGDYREVAAEQDAFGIAGMVVDVGLEGVGGHFSLENAEKGGVVERVRAEGDLFGH